MFWSFGVGSGVVSPRTWWSTYVRMKVLQRTVEQKGLKVLGFNKKKGQVFFLLVCKKKKTPCVRLSVDEGLGGDRQGTQRGQTSAYVS